jgi:pantoate--beta-alanine ligase
MSLHDFSLFYPSFRVSPDVTMRIINDLAEMIETARGWQFGGTVGCVVIMGSVHAGHLSLIHAARVRNEICVVCILPSSCLTPTDSELLLASTYISYGLIQDLELLKNAGTDVVFMPYQQNLYPADFSTYVTSTTSWSLPDALGSDGANAFSTLMLKLYHLLHPDVLYFGQRELRRVAMLRRLVRDFHLDVELVVLPTFRDQSGLALSNTHFSEAEYTSACLLYKALLLGKSLIEQGERCAQVIVQAMCSSLADDSLILLQHVSICHMETLKVLQDVVPDALLEISIQIGSILLTDNIIWLGDERWLL